MSEIPIIGKIGNIEFTPNGNQIFEVELSVEGMSILGVEEKCIQIRGIDCRQQGISRAVAKIQGISNENPQG